MERIFEYSKYAFFKFYKPIRKTQELIKWVKYRNRQLTKEESK